MRKVFRNETKLLKIKETRFVFVHYTWMCCERGEGELGITNQGWSRVKSFSQETEAKGQQVSWNDTIGPKLTESSAGCTRLSDSTPHFFSNTNHLHLVTAKGRTHRPFAFEVSND